MICPVCHKPLPSDHVWLAPVGKVDGLVTTKEVCSQACGGMVKLLLKYPPTTIYGYINFPTRKTK